MERHSASALQVATWLQQQPQIDRVYYPGLADHPGHDLLCRQAAGSGGMLSFRVTSPALAERVLEKLRLISFAESLGGVETLITLPAMQTHGDIPRSERERLGICNSLLRLSVGLEEVADLIEDLSQALH